MTKPGHSPSAPPPLPDPRARPEPDPFQLQAYGKFQLAGLIARGGMAEVFLALQEGVGGFSKIVALKRILPHLSGSPEFVTMFLDEARLASRLDHPNIVRIYELGELEGQYYI